MTYPQSRRLPYEIILSRISGTLLIIAVITAQVKADPFSDEIAYALKGD